MKAGNSVCFYKVDGVVIDSTATSEFDSRANGAVRVHKRKVQILEWSKTIEQNYRGKRGSVLVSGPMLLSGGELSDWSRCSKSFVQTRHPRSALLVTRRGDVMMLTVDGRSKGNADGMSIPELAFLAKQLGAVEAINLDGGGSTTLWLRGEGVVNYPCDNRLFDHAGERSVSNAIYVK
jgi:exopolysaccharide biosynthesis protein